MDKSASDTSAASAVASRLTAEGDEACRSEEVGRSGQLDHAGSSCAVQQTKGIVAYLAGGTHHSVAQQEVA